VISVDIELALVGLVAMLEPATLISSVLALVLGDRPLRTGFWFYLGGLGVTLAVGVAAAFVLGDVAASPTSKPKTWVSVVSVVAGALLVLYVAWSLRRHPDPRKTAASVARMRKVVNASPATLIGAGAVLANAGPFMLIAMKNISQLDPTTLQYILDWLLFALVSLLPLALALVALLIAPEWTMPRLVTMRGWIERHARTVALVVVSALAVSLIRDGIAGLTG
jgi:hypothetical protein